MLVVVMVVLVWLGLWEIVVLAVSCFEDKLLKIWLFWGVEMKEDFMAIFREREKGRRERERESIKRWSRSNS